MPLHQSPISKLPNELLAWVIEYVGPPDLISGASGWLVFTAVCKHWRKVAKSLPLWRAGRVDQHDYSCIDELLDSDALSELGLPQSFNTPITVFTTSDTEACADWTLRVACNGSETDIISGPSLEIFPEGPDHLLKQMVDRYLNTLPLTGKPPGLRFEWVTSIHIHCDNESIEDGDTEFDFLTIPCIFAPALSELCLINYVVDWRCESLESLKIDLMRAQQLVYDPERLLRRMGESRLTLSRVVLRWCFPWRSDTMHLQEPLSTINFPRLSDFYIRDEPRESWWFRLHMILPYGSIPTLQSASFSVKHLRELSLGCSHPKLTAHADHDDNISRGALTALHLSIKLKNHRKMVTTVGSLERLPHCSSCAYLGQDAEIDTVVPALTDTSEGPHVDLDGPLPFQSCWEWNLTRWEMPVDIAPAYGQMLQTAFYNVKAIVIRYDPDLLGDDEDVAIRTSIFRQVPNVSQLTFVGFSSDSFAPLVVMPALVPGLETIHLYSRFDDAEEYIESSCIIDLLKCRADMGHPISSIGLGKTVRVNGDSRKVLELYNSGVCLDLDDASV